MTPRLDPVFKTIQNLKNSLNTEIITVRDKAGTIKFFELTYELSWKSLETYLEQKEGIITKSPREAINEAYRIGLIKNESLWLEIMKVRNVSTHVYDEEGMEPLIKRLPDFLQEFESLYERLKNQ